MTNTTLDDRDQGPMAADPAHVGGAARVRAAHQCRGTDPFLRNADHLCNSRFLSDAIDPTVRGETPRQQIDGRVADNMLPQNFVFAIASARSTCR